MQNEEGDKFATAWIEAHQNVMCACIHPNDWDNVREIIHDAFVAGFNKKCELDQIGAQMAAKNWEGNVCK